MSIYPAHSQTVDCPSCQGRGEAHTACADCNGTGKEPCTFCRGDAPDCRYCSGTGLHLCFACFGATGHTGPCADCAGSGHVIPEIATRLSWERSEQANSSGRIEVTDGDAGEPREAVVIQQTILPAGESAESGESPATPESSPSMVEETAILIAPALTPEQERRRWLIQDARRQRRRRLAHAASKTVLRVEAIVVLAAGSALLAIGLHSATKDVYNLSLSAATDVSAYTRPTASVRLFHPLTTTTGGKRPAGKDAAAAAAARHVKQILSRIPGSAPMSQIEAVAPAQRSGYYSAMKESSSH